MECGQTSAFLVIVSLIGRGDLKHGVVRGGAGPGSYNSVTLLAAAQAVTVRPVLLLRPSLFAPIQKTVARPRAGCVRGLGPSPPVSLSLWLISSSAHLLTLAPCLV